MRIRIASRQSDLAKLQAYLVANALRLAHGTGIEIVHQFRESLGDLNLTDPLWKMPEKGVFTEDFHQDLISGQTDVVVHSWKDLPTQPKDQTEIIATLPRADSRDLLLIKKNHRDKIKNRRTLQIYTSSPRRIFHFENFSRSYLPFPIEKIGCEPVRGNIPTRLKKLFASPEIDGMILAKAALDRILESGDSDFDLRETRQVVRQALADSLWCVLPLSLFPSAPAQGALAIEAKKDRADLKSLFVPIHSSQTFKEVQRERKLFSSYGGGCHQKIGVSALERPYGAILFCSGETETGEKLLKTEFERPNRDLGFSPVPIEKIWPQNIEEASLYDRVSIQCPEPARRNYWVAREDALPRNWNTENSLIWTSGLGTWKKLAKRGIWVNGTADSLGEEELPSVDGIAQKSIDWTKLSHKTTEAPSRMQTLATYELVPKESASKKSAPKKSANDPVRGLTGKTHFYWMSASGYDRACEMHPGVQAGYHACGPGNTFRILKAKISDPSRLKIYLNYETWLKEIVA